MLLTLAITLVAFAAVMLMMSVGVLLSGRCLRGSCGGPDVLGPNGVSLLCETCPHRDEPAEEPSARRGVPLPLVPND